MTEGLERVTFSAVVDEQGEIKAERVNEARGRLSRFVPKKDRRVLVTVSRYVKPKTNPQLALFFGAIVPAWCEFTGYEPDEMDTELRRAYLAPQLAVSRLTGEEITERPRIRDLNAEEMATFIDRVLKEGRLLGIEFDMEAAAS